VGGGTVIVVTHREALHLHAVAVGGIVAADDETCGNVGEFHHNLLSVGRQGRHNGSGRRTFGLAADAVLLGQCQLGQSLGQLQLTGRVGKIGPVLGGAQIHIHGHGGVGDQGQGIHLLDADDIQPGEIPEALVAVVGELDVVEGEVLTEASTLVGHQQGKIVGILLGQGAVAALAFPLEEEHGLKAKPQDGVDEGIVVAALLDVGAEVVALAVSQLNGDQLADTGTACGDHDHTQGDTDVLRDLMGEVPAQSREAEGCFPVGALPAPVGVDDVGLGCGAQLLVGVGVALGLGKEAEVIPIVELDAGGIAHAGRQIHFGVGLTADEPHVSNEDVLEGHGMVTVVGNDHDLGLAFHQVGGEGQCPAVILAHGGGDGLTHKAACHAGAGGIRKAPHADGLLSLQNHVGGENTRDLKVGADPGGGGLGGGGLLVGGKGGGILENLFVIHKKSFQKDLTNLYNMVYYNIPMGSSA